MGLMDSLKKQLDCSKDKSIILSIKFGFKELGINSISTMRQKENGDIYFNSSDQTLYRIIAYEWEGPLYENIVTTNTKSNSQKNTTKKGKAGRMTAGAVIGTVLFPGVGTVVGAAIGAGGKGKAKTVGTSNTDTVQKNAQIEKDNTALLKFSRVDDGKICTITINCNSNIDSQLRCFNITPNQDVSSISKQTIDALNGIKALKELLDIGAITQEEFENKKKELL